MKIKPVSPSVDYDTRIDGIFFQHAGATKIGRIWRYPTSSPSNRFRTVNGWVLELSAAYDALDPFFQATWQAQAVAYPFARNCAPEVAYPATGDVYEDGRRSYIANNVARRAIDMSDAVTPDALEDYPDGDIITLSLDTGGPAPVLPLCHQVAFAWSRDSVPFYPFVGAYVYLHAAYSVPANSIAPQHWSLAGYTSAFVDFPTDITSIVQGWPGLVNGATIGVRVCLAQQWTVPFAAAQAFFRNSF